MNLTRRSSELFKTHKENVHLKGRNLDMQATFTLQIKLAGVSIGVLSWSRLRRESGERRKSGREKRGGIREGWWAAVRAPFFARVCFVIFPFLLTESLVQAEGVLTQISLLLSKLMNAPPPGRPFPFPTWHSAVNEFRPTRALQRRN